MLTLIQYNKSTHLKEENITPKTAHKLIEEADLKSWLDIESHNHEILKEVINLLS